MKAYVVEKYKKGEPLVEHVLPAPAPGPSDVVVRIEAAGLNLLDIKIRNGEFKPILAYKPPFILGHDLAGTVTSVGSQVRRFKVGDAVYARPRDGRIGAFAEAIAIHEDDVALKPANLSVTEAAGVPLVALTAWQALVEVGQVKPGQKVFIQAGSGGVGTIAIQLAKHLGATVATTCGASSIDLVKGLGADVAIDYRTQDIEKELSGYDLVLHSQDDATLQKSLRVLKPGGHLISISGPPTPTFAKAQGLNFVLRLVLGLISRKARKAAARLGVNYSFLFMRADGGQLAEIAKLIEEGTIKPVLDRTFPFRDLNKALSLVESGRAKGKVVVELG
ncbi:NADP-dependent oxidoreductase [Neorhizobium sp. JUb45]|uniref:NADP-dependent oxidoreductase n=1 Tax=Neorhizobium sp. JUb45 TaxID=2485113 RepID=UPI00104FB2C6|nr:NADP-dependent oxidoreductase [Neorhizobium sp. JUb45]TCQ99117.1 NADPH:quinone reductase-like Zn-dependent oxidoreductase [Neorhizobium sp. JUb45]